MKKQLIKDGWRSYAEHVLPADAPSVQTQETRRAFYAGAQHLFSVYFDIGGDEISEDQGVEILEEIKAELQRFVRDVVAGKA